MMLCECVSITLKGHSFYNLLIFARTQDLICHWISKQMMGEIVFQLHIATPTYATGPMFLHKARQKFNRVIFPCWCTTGSSFPVGMQ